MVTKIMAQVVEVSLKEEYPKKPSGITDYAAPKITYFASEIRILDNPLQITGVLILREKLAIGSLHEIKFSISEGQQTAEIQGDMGGEIVVG